MKKGKIKAAIVDPFTNEPRRYEEIDALVDDRGLLATAKMLPPNSGMWAVYHVPTGYSDYRRRRDAVDACYRLAQHDWNFRSLKSRKINKLKPRVQAERQRYD